MLQQSILVVCLTLLFGLVLYRGMRGSPDVPYAPSSTGAVRDALSHLDLNGKRFIDLGSGDGRVVIAAARLGAEAHGIEINPTLVWFSRLRARLSGQPAHFRRGSFLEAPLGGYDVVYLYVLADAMERLYPRLESELRPGTVVVSNTFRFLRREPDGELGYHFWMYRF